MPDEDMTYEDTTDEDIADYLGEEVTEPLNKAIDARIAAAAEKSSAADAAKVKAAQDDAAKAKAKAPAKLDPAGERRAAIAAAEAEEEAVLDRIVGRDEDKDEE